MFFIFTFNCMFAFLFDSFQHCIFIDSLMEIKLILILYYTNYMGIGKKLLICPCITYGHLFFFSKKDDFENCITTDAIAIKESNDIIK